MADWNSCHLRLPPRRRKKVSESCVVNWSIQVLSLGLTKQLVQLMESEEKQGGTTACLGAIRGKRELPVQPREAMSDRATLSGKSRFFHRFVQPMEQEIPFVSPHHQGFGSQAQSGADSQQLLGWRLPKTAEFLGGRVAFITAAACCLRRLSFQEEQRQPLLQLQSAITLLLVSGRLDSLDPRGIPNSEAQQLWKIVARLPL